MKLLLCLTAIIFSSEVFAKRSTIETVPSKAKIYIKIGKTEKKEIGVTPLKVETNKLFKEKESVNTYLIIEKEGFRTQNLVIANAKDSNIKLMFNLVPVSKFKSTKEIDELAAQLFSAQRLIRNQGHSEALKLLDQMDEKFPELSILPELKGSVFYLERKFEKALGAYREAFVRNTSNQDAERMKLFLEKKLGLKSK